MKIEYQRGTAALGPLVMKRLEEHGLAVVDAEEFLSLQAGYKRLETSLLDLMRVNSELQTALNQSQRGRLEAQYQALPTTLPQVARPPRARKRKVRSAK